LFRCPSVEANPTNPASSLTPEHRTAQRTKLIAEILARVAVAAEVHSRDHVADQRKPPSAASKASRDQLGLDTAASRPSRPMI